MTLAALKGLEEGRPWPLGACFDGKGVNFALFSAHAEKVELCLFDARGYRELKRLELPAHTDQVFHGYLEHGEPGLLYGYRVYGPYDPKAGHRFNHHKLLLDPYARQIVCPFRWTDAHFGYRVGAATADLTFDSRNNASRMVKAAVVDPSFSWGDHARPVIRASEAVIYECHVRGMTKLNTRIPVAWRGSVAGLASEPVLEHLLKLGVTSLELMPVHAFLDDRLLVERGLRNYWGYNTIGFFAPEPRYLRGGRIDEFKTMVRRLHAAGIEVLLDVVYNHTAEGNELGPTLSFKGIDNRSYYRLVDGEPRYYVNDTGTGNTLDLSHPRVLQMAMDSLRYWVVEMGVDGFRFDLATTLAREDHGFDPGSGFLDAVRQDPVLQTVKLIAEPWDIGPGGYQLGQFPPGWSEWNDNFRDGVRRFWRGDEGSLPDLARVVAGTADRFDHDGRRPQASVNFVTSHDGFTLADLVSYEHRHNEANGEENGDGHEANFSANYGVEGPSEEDDIRAVRLRQRRNFLATLFLAQGVPMLLMGDELGHSQQGNNNAYCQDNEIGWLDWAGVRDEDDALADFVARLARLRRDHPALRAEHFLHGHRASREGLIDIFWLNADGAEMREADWSDPQAKAVGMRLNGRVVAPESDPPEAVLLAYFNAGEALVEVTIPCFQNCSGWRWVLDTVEPGRARFDVNPDERYRLAPRSVTLFAMLDRHGEAPAKL